MNPNRTKQLRQAIREQVLSLLDDRSLSYDDIARAVGCSAHHVYQIARESGKQRRSSKRNVSAE